MMTTDIVNEIARLMAQREVGLKDPKDAKEIKAKRDLAEVRDQVTLSETAKSFASQEADGGYAAEQAMKVERLKALVNGGNYHMDKEMVESIAERIANMLV
jgi:anti-sigma28 factor (negative regulator of flagellin synthesis)